MTQQTEAQRLADALGRAIQQTDDYDDVIHVARWFVQDAAAELRRLEEEIQQQLEALEKLARLGNGDQYGNSQGNMIARAAIAAAKEQP